MTNGNFAIYQRKSGMGRYNDRIIVYTKWSVDNIPEDATRLGKALTKLASPLSDAGITVARTKTKNSRGISLTRH